MPPQRVGFGAFLVWDGYTLCPFWSGIGYGFRGNYGSVWKYLSFQFQMSKKESDICEFEMDFWKYFCLRSNLSNNGRISALRPGLKTGMDFRALVWKRVWKMTLFFVSNRVRIWRNGRHTPSKIFQEYPPPPGHNIILSFSFILFRFNSYSVQEIFTNEQRIMLSCSSHKYLIALQGRFWPSNYKVLSWSSGKELRFLFHRSKSPSWT